MDESTFTIVYCTISLGALIWVFRTNCRLRSEIDELEKERRAAIVELDEIDRAMYPLGAMVGQGYQFDAKKTPKLLWDMFNDKCSLIAELRRDLDRQQEAK